MIYSYKAKTGSGEIKSGEMKAKSKVDLDQKVGKLGLMLISSEEISDKKKNFEISKIIKRVSVVDKMLFARHLGVMLRAGLPFSRATTVLAQQTSNAYFRDILESIR
ncbi:hypothetical protein KAK05_03910, partial [Candidatus Parcubacteria bacterium]|nr:hypothetical protein [Candidatus Parcubacteria bacterium]